jgi:hypothetical protein
MARSKTPAADADVVSVAEVLKKGYGAKHARAKIDVYRYNSCSIRIRVIDPDFNGLDRVERDNLIWEDLENLDEDTRSQVTMIVLLVPGEEKTSLGNLEFSNPSPPLGIL